MDKNELIKFGDVFLRSNKDDRKEFFLLSERERELVITYLKTLELLDQKRNKISVNKNGLMASRLGLSKYLKRSAFNENTNRYGFYMSVFALFISILFNLYFIFFSN